MMTFGPDLDLNGVVAACGLDTGAVVHPYQV